MVRELLFAAAVVTLSGTAHADWDDRYETRQIVVAAADLDLSTSAGIAELYRRVDRAVNRICGSDRVCRDEAWESTEDQAQAAIDHDKWMRRLAYERLAQLRACGRQGCAPQPARTRYAPAYPAPPVTYSVSPGTIVTVVIRSSGPVYYRR
ncbi:MAG: UrcA family protein [Pseudomonadota bacterium]|uniref:UrcA family protein n=1 Tax=Sphingomonas sp. ERG5 TaxID=1381597 RepID=UPI00054B7B8D|nr:UrcA family protein [Sphingomonas sp. ERG5]